MKSNFRKKSITIRIDELTLEYFKKMSADGVFPYQMLNILFLRDCRIQRRKLSMKWKLGPNVHASPSRGPVRCHACRRPFES